MPSTPSVPSPSARAAAQAMAAAVLRAAGSSRSRTSGSPASVARSSGPRSDEDTTEMRSAGASQRRRDTVISISVSGPSRRTKGLGRARRLAGQKRVPAPPASTTG